MNEREIGRAIARQTQEAAVATSAVGRGVVTRILDDGRLVIQLPGGAKITKRLASPLKVASGVALSLLRSGNRYEVQDISPWQGGLGAPEPAP